MQTETILTCIEAVKISLLTKEDEIESLDRAIGDGDHFINVKRGCTVIMAMRDDLAKLPPYRAFEAIGSKLLSTIGGASGPLIASFFLTLGKRLEKVERVDAKAFSAAFAAGVEAIRKRGNADRGQKTMLDVLIPVARSFEACAASGASFDETCDVLIAEAEKGMLSTRDMIATKGRAYFLGERAIGHIDPGSRTSQVAITAVCERLRRVEPMSPLTALGTA